jgi:hypothetical protein
MNYIFRIFVIVTLVSLTGCYGGTKLLNFKGNNQIKFTNTLMCYQLNPDIKLDGNIYSTDYLETKNKRLSFNYNYRLTDHIHYIRPIHDNCNNSTVFINEINIFRFDAFDTSQWRTTFY